jgi:hypothetical protein
LNRTWLAAQRTHVETAAALGGIFAVAAVAYWWTAAPLYNPSATIDPWLYTALFVNFDEIYEHFSNTYYAARLPWIVPGRFLYGVLPLDAAYWVLHGLAFCGGVAALFFLVLRFLGLAPAIVGAATLALTQMYWNAQYWDYVDGAMMTFLLGGLCFGLPLAVGRRRALSLAVAGGLFTAAVATNLLAGAFAVVYPVAYFFVQPATGLRQRLAMALKDVVALLAGAAALVVALGLYARAHGGPFEFYEPQIDVVRGGISAATKIEGYEWMQSEGRLLVPVFLCVVAVPLLILGRRLPPFRFAAGAIAGLAVLTAEIYGWEFFAGGAALDYIYASSNFAAPIALAMAAVAGLLLSLAPVHRATELGAPTASIVTAVVALVLVYKDEHVARIGETGARTSIALMALAGVLIAGAVLTRRLTIGVPLTVAAVAAAAFASHYAINSSTQVFTYGASAPESRNLYHAAQDTVEFVDDATKESDPLPTFWYRGLASHLASIQSMYFYAFTAIGWELPKVNTYTRQWLNQSKPQRIVMLCETPDCNGGAAALRRAGYPYAEADREHISRGSVRFWAVMLRTSAVPTPDPSCVVHDGDLLRARTASEIYAYWAGRKHWIASMDALMAAFGPNALTAVRDVPSNGLARLPAGPRITSAQGWAKIMAGGSKDRLGRVC